jgi:hypothetical protein
LKSQTESSLLFCLTARLAFLLDSRAIPCPEDTLILAARQQLVVDFLEDAEEIKSIINERYREVQNENRFPVDSSIRTDSDQRGFSHPDCQQFRVQTPARAVPN